MVTAAEIYADLKKEEVKGLSQVIISFIDDLRAERRLYPELYAEDLAATILKVLEQ